MKKILILLLTVLSLSVWADSSMPRSEYPRPQFERQDWLCLNGQWTYAFDFGRTGSQKGWTNSQGFDGKITVPFCPESRLSGVEHTDFISSLWYQRTITVPAAWTGKNILLHFGAVDYESHIYVNGKKMASHYGAGTGFAVDITSQVRPGESANLVVQVIDNLRDGLQPGGKQSISLRSAGCNYTRVTGIWQTVWMEPVDQGALKRVFAVPDIDQGQLVVHPEFYQESMSNTLTVVVRDGKKVVATKTVKANNHSTVVLPIKNAKLWSPESPFLYDVLYTVRDQSGQVIDQVTSYAGMRKVHCQNGYFYLNNQPYFQRLVLDQGFYPDGVWTAPTDEALRHDIEMSKAVGFNGARLHQKVFEERYLYWADKLGYITWGEQASWGCNDNSDLAARNFLSEWTEEIIRDRNHPSIVTWTPLNETWNVTNQGASIYVRKVQDLYTLTKGLDPTRPVNDASGDGHVRTDIWTVHDYSRTRAELTRNHSFEPGKELYRNMRGKDFLANYEGQPYMVDEFGGLPWIPVEDRASSWGYGSNIDSLDEFYRILEEQVDAIAACPHIVGFCYTQITDVEQEKNGIYYYDRRPKFDTARIKSIFEKIPSVIAHPVDLTK